MRTAIEKACGWKCGDPELGHKHFAVLARENGKLLGRLTPDGRATKRNVHAAVLSKARAEELAGEINSAGSFTATVIEF